MLNLIVGPPGGGKSYEAVAFHVIPALQAGRRVITNLPLNRDAFAKLDPEFPSLIKILEPEEGNLVRFKKLDDYGDPWRNSETGAGCLYVVDEAHIPLPRKGSDIAVEHWFSMHRHELADVLLMTQSTGKLNKHICDMVQTMFTVKKNVALGSHNSYTRKQYDGASSRGQNSVSTQALRYNKKYFPLYQSHTKSSGSTESKATNVRSIWRHPVFKVLILFLMFLLYRVATSDFSLLGGSKKPPVKVESNVVAPDANPTLPVLPLPQAAPAVADPPPLDEYPFARHVFAISMRMKVGKVEKVTIIAQSPEGGRISLTPDDLTAAGYTVKFTSDCFAQLNYFTGKETKKNFATCGNLPSVKPPLGGTAQNFAVASSQQENFGGGGLTAPIAQNYMRGVLPSSGNTPLPSGERLNQYPAQPFPPAPQAQSQIFPAPVLPRREAAGAHVGAPAAQRQQPERKITYAY